MWISTLMPMAILPPFLHPLRSGARSFQTHSLQCKSNVLGLLTDCNLLLYTRILRSMTFFSPIFFFYLSSSPHSQHAVSIQSFIIPSQFLYCFSPGSFSFLFFSARERFQWSFKTFTLWSVIDVVVSLLGKLPPPPVTCLPHTYITAWFTDCVLKAVLCITETLMFENFIRY